MVQHQFSEVNYINKLKVQISKQIQKTNRRNNQSKKFQIMKIHQREDP
jgi:hypothetical protein